MKEEEEEEAAAAGEKGDGKIKGRKESVGPRRAPGGVAVTARELPRLKGSS